MLSDKISEVKHSLPGIKDENLVQNGSEVGLSKIDHFFQNTRSSKIKTKT
jgi:hypothetical protein